MLQLLIGPSGSGKSHEILTRLDALTREGQQNILWLVPEQHSFESERALLTHLGAKRAAMVQVLSFSRLADRVFAEVGGVAGRRLDEGVRALLMSRALEQVASVSQDEETPMQGLKPRLSTDCSYVEQLMTLWEELRRCAVTTEELERVAEVLKEDDATSLLTEKVEDLHRVYSAYEGLAVSTGLDELDELTRLAQRLPASRLPVDAAVFVDGFKGFTAQELAVLEQLMVRCREMTVALGCELPGSRREYTLFSPVTKTVTRLQKLADSHGMTWDVVALTENHRTDSGALKALGEGLYAPLPVVYEGDAAEVTITPCADVYEECRYAVRTIRRLLREGYRCREMTVAVRNPEDYAGILDEMLTCEEIPCFMDTRHDLLCEPLVVYVRCALRLAVGGWRTEELLRLMKTDLWPLSPVEIAQLENYVYTWRIEGNRWEEEWTENPAGMDREMHTPDRLLLERLNRHRQKLMTSLGGLREALRGSVSGRGFATAVYDWLASQKGLPARIAAQAQVLEELAQPVLADHAARLWDEMMKILDRFAVALDSQRLSAQRLEELFTMLCRMLDMGTIPQGLDAVTVGAVDRIRYNAPKVVLVLGANEGVLPAYPMGDGLLTEEERQRLTELDLSLAEDVLTQCVEERYYAYQALTAPSERLYVTYQTDAETGPSPVVGMMRRILPRHTVGVASRADGSDLETAAEMFERLSVGIQDDSSLTATLRQVMEEHPDYAPRMEAVERAATGSGADRVTEEHAVELYSQDLCLSATKVSTFHKCRFMFFCQYGLRLKEREIAKVGSNVFGTLVHYAMEKLVPEYCAEGGLLSELRAQGVEENPIPDAALMRRLEADARRIITAYVDEFMGGLENKDGRFQYQVGLAQRSAAGILWHLLTELRQSEFTPHAYEVNIEPEDRLEAVEEKEGKKGLISFRLPLKNGSLQMNGKIDRVDLFTRDKDTFVRIVDYKTGSTTFNLYELPHGLGLQLLIYLFTLCDNSRRYLERDAAHPAGALYHPVTDLLIKQGTKSQERLKAMKMDGVVLADTDVVLAMEQGAEGVYIPAKLDAGGQLKDHVITNAQFDLIRRMTERVLTAMGDALLSGDVTVLPTKSGKNGKLPCGYCDYKAVCGRDADDPEFVIEEKNFEPALAELEEVMGDGDQMDG